MAAKRKSISISNGPTGASKTYLTITEEIRQGHLTDINNKQVNVLLKLNRELVDYETKSNQNLNHLSGSFYLLLKFYCLFFICCLESNQSYSY